ncbi:hypothetical protein NDU88_002933, partial [Pleurodeles waltl]
VQNYIHFHQRVWCPHNVFSLVTLYPYVCTSCKHIFISKIVFEIEMCNIFLKQALSVVSTDDYNYLDVLLLD